MLAMLQSLLDQLSFFLDQGIFDWFETSLEYAASYYILASIKFKLYMLHFSYETAQILIQQLTFDDVVISAWGSLPSSVLGIFQVLKLPESFNLILSAYTTRFVMDFLS